MVNLLYRGVAPLEEARRLVLAGEIGEVKHVEASYLQSWLAQPAWGDWRTDDRWLWRLSTRHGSNGVLGDIGVHLFDFVCHGAALDVTDVHCRLKTFPKAENDRIGDYRLDANDSVTVNAGFDNGAIGVIHASRWASGHQNELRLRIYGDKGGLEVSCLRGGHLVADPRYTSLRGLPRRGPAEFHLARPAGAAGAAQLSALRRRRAPRRNDRAELRNRGARPEDSRCQFPLERRKHSTRDRCRSRGRNRARAFPLHRSTGSMISPAGV